MKAIMRRVSILFATIHVNIRARQVTAHPFLLSLAAAIVAAIVAFFWTGTTVIGASVEEPPGIPVSGGTLAVNTEWTLEESPYIVQGNVTVGDGVTLTIQPGVEVRFREGMRLSVLGTLLAEGTPDQPITFTSNSDMPKPGDWATLWVRGGARARLGHCNIVYAGYGASAALTIDASLQGGPADAHVHNCHIHDTDGHGIRLSGSGLSPIFQDLQISRNAGVAVVQSTPSMSPTYYRLSLVENGSDRVEIQGGSISGEHFWAFQEAGAVIQVNNLLLPGGASLTLEPGTRLSFTEAGVLTVRGALYALGTPAEPVILAGMGEGPGSWQGVHVRPEGVAILRHCQLKDGGAGGEALLTITSHNVMVQDCSIQGSAGHGIRVANRATPLLRNNAIVSNAVGAHNTLPDTPVDAQNNWWGHDSGPFHPTLNPAGQGNPVSDGVLFDPWMTDPTGTAVGSEQLLVQVLGPRIASPGQTVDYLVRYANYLNTPVEQAVLLVALPNTAELMEASGDAIFWPQRHQVFWKLGDLAPGDLGLKLIRVRYEWGLPAGHIDTTMALFGALDVDTDVFDVRPYLAYAPPEVVSQEELDDDAMQAERTAFSELDMLYGVALADGFIFGRAIRYVLNDGSTLLQLTFVNPTTKSAFYLYRGDASIWAEIYTPSVFTLRDVGGGVTIDPYDDTLHLWGTWQTEGSTEQRLATQRCALGTETCVRNCLLENLPGWLIANRSRVVNRITNGVDCVRCGGGDKDSCIKCGASVADIPLVGEVVDARACYDDCTKPGGDRDRYCCTQDKLTCGRGIIGTLFGVTYLFHHICDTNPNSLNFGRYIRREAIPCDDTKWENCTCMEGVGCACCNRFTGQPTRRPSTQSSTPAWTHGLLQGSSAACDDQECELQPGRDPNAKFGPAGDLLPGQLVTYTITYENEGEGIAFGVYIVDAVDEHFDTDTLTIHGDGQFLTASRRIVWSIGELAPKGEPGSTGVVSFTVRLRDDLPSGTLIVNQAIVYFPSVPEETPTNVVVNVIQPLAAIPQTVETQAGQPVAITLEGREVGNAPLTYQIVDPPRFGELTGSPPSLVYTPMDSFNGPDRFTFSVSNVMTQSQPAEVGILVTPSAGDVTPPAVLWTAPAADATQVSFNLDPIRADDEGAIYAPSIRIGFSEALDSDTVTGASFQVFTTGGRALSTTVHYDGATHQVVIGLREPLIAAEQYRVVVAREVADLAGNPLPAEYTWSFRTMGAVDALYLPFLAR